MERWQRERAATKAARTPRLALPLGLACGVCHHVRSSHNPLIVTGACRVTGCDCVAFDPFCECGHLLSDHAWGTTPKPLACWRDRCGAFTPGQGDTQLQLL